MSKLINNLVNYLYLKDREREENSVIKIHSKKYFLTLFLHKLIKESQLKIVYF